MELEPKDRTETIAGRSATPEGVRTGDRAPARGEYELVDGDPERYSNRGEHARGGLGRVVRAHDHRLGRTVAIKELLQTSPEAEQRFVREALITARLQHPGIVPVHEAGRWPNGDPYYVMKLISGRSMKELIRDRPDLRDRMALLPSVIAVAETIAYAHSEGIIHRDIKPANVMVGEFGEAVVVDWGIAKDRRGEIAPPPGETVTGADGSKTAGVLGTPAYMPPEQANGDAVDERSDVYALGALLYELLAGEQPYSNEDSGDVLARVIAGPPSPVEDHEPGVPPDLIAVVCKAMAREPIERYATAKELAEDLKRFQTGQLVSAHDYSAMTLVKRWMWRNRALVGVVAAAAALLVVLGALAIGRIVEERNVAEKQKDQAEQATADKEAQRRQLLLLQARSSLARDPTEAVAWLKTYPQEGAGVEEMRAMLSEAEALGVAHHVLALGDWGFDAAFSPDSRTLAVSSKDANVYLFDVASGEGRTLGEHDAPVYSVELSPDGGWLAAGSESGKVWLWNLETGESRHADGHDGIVRDVRFHPSGKRLVSMAEKYHARVWDLETFEPVMTRKGLAEVSTSGDTLVIHDLDSRETTVIDPLSRDERTIPAPPHPLGMVAVTNGGGKVVGIGRQTGRILLWEGGESWRELGTHDTRMFSLQFSPSGRWVLSMGFDKTIHVYDTAAEEPREPRYLRGHDDALYMAAFGPDERYIVSAGDDGTARVWDLEIGGAIRVLRGHQDDVYRVAISPDGAWIASVSLDGTARVWASQFGDPRRMLLGTSVAGVRFIDDGSLGAHAHDGMLSLLDIESREHRDLGMTCEPTRARYSSVMSENGQSVAGVSPDHEAILVWTGDAAAPIRLEQDGFEKPNVRGFSPGGRTLLATYGSGEIALWDVEAQSVTLLGEGPTPAAATLSPEGDEVAVAHEHGVGVWSLAAGEMVFERDAEALGFEHPMWTRAVEYSGDGRWLAFFNFKGETALYDRHAEQLRLLSSGGEAITHATFSPDGRWIAAAGTDRTVKLWETETGEEIVLRGHGDLVHQVAFSPDSQLLASASYDKTVRVWQPETGASRVLRGHNLSVDSVTFSPDGSQIASASRDGSVRLWDAASLFAPIGHGEIQRRLEAVTTAVIADDNRPLSARP